MRFTASDQYGFQLRTPKDQASQGRKAAGIVSGLASVASGVAKPSNSRLTCTKARSIGVALGGTSSVTDASGLDVHRRAVAGLGVADDERGGRGKVEHVFDARHLERGVQPR